MYIVGEGNGGLEKEYQRCVYIYLHRSVYVYMYVHIYPKTIYVSQKEEKKKFFFKRINLIISHAHTDIKYKIKRICYT